MVNRFLVRMAGALFPHYCALCGLPSGCDLPLCPACRGDLQPNLAKCARCALPLPGQSSASLERRCGQCLVRPPDFDRALAPWLYDEMLAHLIHRWKFGGEHHLSALLASLWLRANPAPTAVDILVPIPLHWRRRWLRGYNQAALLCNELKRQCPALGDRVIDGSLLHRKQATAPQSGLNARERRQNLQGAFTVNHPCDNLRLALVDDVLTTGATVTAAAVALRNAGAEYIEIWCLARTPAGNM